MSPRPVGPDLVSATSSTLLQGLFDVDNHAAWGSFVARYRPLVVRAARGAGLDSAAAEDVAQQSLIAFASSYREGRYERESGRLRSWLFGIVQHKIVDWRRRGPREAAKGGTREAVLDEAVAADEMSALWEREWRAAVLRAALDEVRHEVEPSTFAAFEGFALGERPAEEVAHDLGLSVNAVYGAKRRILKRLRGLLPRLEEEW